jgi:hypothetical protein
MKGSIRLKDIKKSTLTVVFKGNTYEVDLDKELSIDPNLIDSSLSNSPSNYALLCMIRDRLVNKRDSLEKEKDLAYSKAWIYYKESNSRISNEMASHKAEVNPAYQGALKRYMKASMKASKMISLCRAYENRESILRTISANLRNQH